MYKKKYINKERNKRKSPKAPQPSPSSSSTHRAQQKQQRTVKKKVTESKMIGTHSHI